MYDIVYCTEHVFPYITQHCVGQPSSALRRGGTKMNIYPSGDRLEIGLQVFSWFREGEGR